MPFGVDFGEPNGNHVLEGCRSLHDNGNLWGLFVAFKSIVGERIESLVLWLQFNG